MNNPQIPAGFRLTGNAALDGLILRVLVGFAASIATAIVTWLGAHHFSDPNLQLMISTALVAVFTTGATLIYGFVLSKVNQAKAVQAGINLTVSGNALAQDGKTVVDANDGTTPPLGVTTKTAPEIVKNFATPMPRAA